jgi:hypothetical protein
MRNCKLRAAVLDCNPSGQQCFPRKIIVAGPVAPGRIEHDANVHAAPSRGDHGLEQCRISKQEHANVQAMPGGFDRIDDRVRGIIG